MRKSHFFLLISLDFTKDYIGFRETLFDVFFIKKIILIVFFKKKFIEINLKEL